MLRASWLSHIDAVGSWVFRNQCLSYQLVCQASLSPTLHLSPWGPAGAPSSAADGERTRSCHCSTAAPPEIQDKRERFNMKNEKFKPFMISYITVIRLYHMHIHSPGQSDRAQPVPPPSQPAEWGSCSPVHAGRSSAMQQQQVMEGPPGSGSHRHTWQPGCRCAASGWRAAPPRTHRCLCLISPPRWRRRNVGKSPEGSPLPCPSGGWRGWDAPFPERERGEFRCQKNYSFSQVTYGSPFKI